MENKDINDFVNAYDAMNDTKTMSIITSKVVIIYIDYRRPFTTHRYHTSISMTDFTEKKLLDALNELHDH